MGLQKMAVGEKSENPQNISASTDRPERSENENGPAPSLATGVGTTINTSFSFSGTGDFQNSETSATESEITPTSSKTAEKDNESVNAKLVNASNESTEAITSSETKAGDSKDANENSQASVVNQTSASALDISYGQEGEEGHCVSFRDEETGQRMLQVNSEVTIFDQVYVKLLLNSKILQICYHLNQAFYAF